MKVVLEVWELLLYNKFCMNKKRSKRYIKALNLISNTENLYDICNLLYKFPDLNFNETIVLSVILARKKRSKGNEKLLKGIIHFPFKIEKSMKIVVFTENPQEALAYGADYAGLDDLIEKIKNGFKDFTVSISTPGAMLKVKSIANILGPKGLMPSLKNKTISEEIGKSIEEVRSNKVEFKENNEGLITVVVGKKSLNQEKLYQNISIALESVLSNAKKERKIIKKIIINSSMNPGIVLKENFWKL